MGGRSRSGEDGGWVKSLERNGLEAQERLRGKTSQKNELHKINFVLRSDNSTVNAVSSVADRAGDCYMMFRVTRETWCTESEGDPVPWYGMWLGCFALENIKRSQPPTRSTDSCLALSA